MREGGRQGYQKKGCRRRGQEEKIHTTQTLPSIHDETLDSVLGVQGVHVLTICSGQLHPTPRNAAWECLALFTFSFTSRGATRTIRDGHLSLSLSLSLAQDGHLEFHTALSLWPRTSTSTFTQLSLSLWPRTATLAFTHLLSSVYNDLMFDVALRPQGLLGTGSPGRPLRLSLSHKDIERRGQRLQPLDSLGPDYNTTGCSNG